MKPICTAMLVLALSTVCAIAQTVDGPHYLLDHRFLAASSQSLHRGTLFVSYHDRGGLFRIDSLGNTPVVVAELEHCIISQLFHVGGNLLASTYSGELWSLDDNGDSWSLIGVYDCHPFTDHRQVFVTRDGIVRSLRFDGSEWIDSALCKIETQSQIVTAIAVVNDTVLYSVDNAKDIEIVSFDGSFSRKVASHGQVERFLLLGDGSIAITADRYTSQYLKAGSLSVSKIEYLYYQSSLVSLSNASQIESGDSSAGMIGTFRVFGDDPREGIYIVYTPDNIIRARHLDSLVNDVTLATSSADRSILSSYGQIAVIHKDYILKRVRWFADTLLSFSDGVSFTSTGLPFFCGIAEIKGEVFPATYIEGDSVGLKLVDIGDEKAGLLIRHVQLDGGPEIAFCSFDLFVKQNTGQWSKQFATTSDFRARMIDVVDDSLIVVRSVPRHILYSLDKGVTWRSVAIKDYLYQMTPVVSAGSTLYGLAQGRVWAVDLHQAADSIEAPSVDLSIGWHQRLFSCTDEVVYMMTARSDVDPAFNPAKYTQIVCHKWLHKTGQVDSATFLLQEPMTSTDLVMFARRDTAYCWSFRHRRLIALTYSGIVFDTTLPSNILGAYAMQGLTSVEIDNDGNPWLFAGSQVAGFRLDPSKSVISSIDDYYNHLYVKSVRPNPANDNVVLTVGRFPAANEKGTSLYLVDLQGNVVRNFTDAMSAFPSPNSTQDVHVDVSGLPWGVYLVVIENSQGKSVGKVVVAH